MDNKKDTHDLPELMFVKFADAEVPEFKEVRNKDFILFGKDNLYPEYLLWLYNKSGKHGAIINSKSKYIAGGGFKSRSSKEGFALPPINNLGETWDDVAKKAIKDVEIFGGARLLIAWDQVGRIGEILHLPFHKVRRGKEAGFLFKDNWKARGDATAYPEFDVNQRKGLQLFAYDEYRPGTDVYPLPEYLPCNNYIETDIEISKFHLSAIKNGMMPSKAIEFFNGDPTDEKKREIEQRMTKKFSGAENAGKFLLFFNSSKEKAINITDLSSSELDKQFDLLNKTCEQEIFTGHQVVSPMLFGIKTKGQLGGTSELTTAYQIFINTYAKPKQADWERIANYFSSLSGQLADLYIEQLDPVGIQIAIDSVVTLLPREFIFEKLNVPKEYWNLPATKGEGVTA